MTSDADIREKLAKLERLFAHGATPGERAAGPGPAHKVHPWAAASLAPRRRDRPRPRPRPRGEAEAAALGRRRRAAGGRPEAGTPRITQTCIFRSIS